MILFRLIELDLVFRKFYYTLFNGFHRFSRPLRLLAPGASKQEPAVSKLDLFLGAGDIGPL
jgi:hypothetical protein